LRGHIEQGIIDTVLFPMMGASCGLTVGIRSTMMACMAGAIEKVPGIAAMDGTLFDSRCLSMAAMRVCTSGIAVPTPEIDGLCFVQMAVGPVALLIVTVFSGSTPSIFVKVVGA
jgi:hypothetical protein